MRQAGTIPDADHAQRLADYLLTLGITTRLDDDDQSGVAVWIHDEEHLERGRRELDEFLNRPDDPKYTNSGSQARQIRRQAEKQQRRVREQTIDMSPRWQRPIGPRPLTFVLIAVSCLVGAVTALGENIEPVVSQLSIKTLHAADQPGAEEFRTDNGLAEVRSGQFWRLITPIFLHFSIWHLGFNMYMTYRFSGDIEVRRGTGKLAAIVLVTAAASNYGQYLASGPYFGGMSGVVYGLFGYIWMKSRYDPRAGLYVNPNTVILLILWFIFCMTGRLGNIGNWAHGVGLAVGMAIGVAPYLWRRMTREK